MSIFSVYRVIKGVSSSPRHDLSRVRIAYREPSYVTDKWMRESALRLTLIVRRKAKDVSA